MQPHVNSTSVTDPDAVEFVRFCHRRRRVGWPELYDEMCAVAARGLFRGYSADDLSGHGIRFGLFDMPALAALTRDVVAAEVAARRPVQVAIHELPAEVEEVTTAEVVSATPTPAAVSHTVADLQPAVIDVRITAASPEPASASAEAAATAAVPPSVADVETSVSPVGPSSDVIEPRPVPAFGQRFRMVPTGA
jgi:hypothetical protein